MSEAWLAARRRYERQLPDDTGLVYQRGGLGRYHPKSDTVNHYSPADIGHIAAGASSSAGRYISSSRAPLGLLLPFASVTHSICDTCAHLRHLLNECGVTSTGLKFGVWIEKTRKSKNKVLFFKDQYQSFLVVVFFLNNTCKS